MKSYLKKSLAIAIAALMSAGTLASCGDSGESSQGGQTTETSSGASQSDSGNSELATLKILTPESDNTYIFLKDREKYPVWQEFESLLADKGVAVDMEIIATDQYQVVLQTRMASANDLPDFANLTHLDDTTALNLANQGTLIPINEILEKGDGTAKNFLEQEVPFVIGVCTASDGNMYWLPNVTQRTTYGGELGSTCMVIMIRQDWLDKVGMEAPTTAEEFVTVMKAFRDQDVNGSGVADEILAFDPSNFANGIAQWFGLGSDLTTINLTTQEVVSPWYQDGVKEYFTYLNRLVNEGILDPSLIGATTSDLQDQKMAENKVGATYSYAMQAWLEPSVNADTEVYYQPIAALQAVDGIEPAIAVEPSELVSGRWGATKACTNLEAAAALLDVVYCDNAETLYNWGIEGDTYEVVDGEKQYLPNIDNAHWEECSQTGNIIGSWLLGTTFPRIRFAAMETEIESCGGGKAEFQKEIIDHEPRYPLGNASYFAQPTLEQLERKAAIQTDLTTYSKELATQLILGQKSIDDWDTYMAELKELGLDEMLEIDQDLYTRFLEAQK